MQEYKFESTARHGKYLLVKISDNGWIIFHFGMTRYLNYFKERDLSPEHTRALFSFVNREKSGRCPVCESDLKSEKSRGALPTFARTARTHREISFQGFSHMGLPEFVIKCVISQFTNTS